MQRKRTGSFIAAAMLLMAGCSDMGNPAAPERQFHPPGGSFYFPGVVVASFVDSMTYVSISRFLAALSLDVRFINADSAFDAWIGVLSGDPSSYVVRLESSPMVEWAEARGYQGGVPGRPYIFVRFNGTTTVPAAQAFVAGMTGLEWDTTLVSTRLAAVNVAVGTEQHWIDTLKTFPVVRWAELDYFISISGGGVLSRR